jgi:hypothetical protein
MLDRSGVVIGDWVEKAWPAPVMVCIENSRRSSWVKAGVWAGGLRGALAVDRCLSLSNAGQSKCKQC